ncbi:hypothetical protein evm_012781 [Chilo suppressalis]|nr:hypothetical protein evm_012781 [Chilo suppressalis]
MFAYISLLCFVALSTGHTITAPNSSKVDIKNFNPSNVKQRSSHVKDFVELVDMEKLMMVAVDHINNNEMNNFPSLEWSTLFHSLINKIVELDEFKKILEFLESKGFSLQFLGNNLNAFIDYSLKKQDDTYIQLQNNPEVARLLEIFYSEEFIDMLKMLLQKIKALFDTFGYALFESVCEFLRNIFGDIIPSKFC